jgi:orotidine-5'-phosphate decarboxylase
MKAHERIILPLDVSNVDAAQRLVKELLPYVGVFKIGFEALLSIVVDFILCPDQTLKAYVAKVRVLTSSIPRNKLFMDMKLADIGNTVGNASKSLARLQGRMFNVHASAGMKAIQAAVANKGMSQVFGVTVLTSIERYECRPIFGGDPEEKVVQFAEMLLINGADGIICAPKEGLILRQHERFKNMKIATPSIRPLWMMKPEERERVKDDQSIGRQLTPSSAAKAGIDMQVIGRPITNPPPEIGGSVKAAQLIAQEIAEATGEEV